VLLAAVAAGSTAAAAQLAGVSERTVRRRLSDPEFQRRVEDARAETVYRALSRISAVAIMATETLVALMEPNEPRSVRLNAAKAVLDMGLRLRAERALKERVGATEQPGTIQEDTDDDVMRELEVYHALRRASSQEGRPDPLG
jgi:hypothetical protein